ncbi:hypothetical protein D029_1047 [Vibrio parahaemolyticus 970107]|nr:hypothetical protein D029_1047 [Vibrio parahaemolyticus 970107]
MALKLEALHALFGARCRKGNVQLDANTLNHQQNVRAGC